MEDKKTKPTDSELEILQILWDKKNATVREVHEALQGIKDCGYTTTLKLMQIMYEKGIVSRNDENKTHIYRPKIGKSSTQKQLVSRMVNNLFGGSTSQLIMQALGFTPPSDEELEAIQQLLDTYKKK